MATSYTMTLILILLLFAAQVLALILIPMSWRKRGGVRSSEELSERMTYTILAPVASIVLSMLDPTVHAFVAKYTFPWVLLSVLAIYVVLRLVEKHKLF